MKRIILVFFILLVLPVCAFAKSSKADMTSIKFNGSKFSLYFSAKSPEAKSYINEYYKKAEGYTNWSELIALFHYPNAYSPIDYAKTFREFLAEDTCPSAIEVDEENNSAILDFLIIDSRKLPIVVEFNIFRYVKSPICGSVGLQYAKRYMIMSPLEIERVKKDILKNRTKYIKQIKKLEIPDLVTVDIEKGKYIHHEGIENNIQSELQLE